MVVRLLLTAAIGYFLGNLNGAFIMYKLLTGEDIRKSGSGNALCCSFRILPLMSFSVFSIFDQVDSYSSLCGFRNVIKEKMSNSDYCFIF